MRKELFRFFDKNKFVYFYIWDIPYQSDFIQSGIVNFSFPTMKNDLSGKMIYEGDIVKATREGLGEETIEVLGFVKYKDCQFSVNGFTINLSDYTEIEIIGNIYENSNLLPMPSSLS